MANILIGHVKGPQGDAATVSVGTTTTGAAGSSASVTNSGTSSAAVLNFTIPKGDKGDAGTPGVTDYATTSTAGLVRVGDDFNINSNNGTLSIKNAFTEASTLANIASGESQATILGKIKKFMTTLMPSNFLVNTTNSTATDKALTANMGKTLAGDLATVQTSATASKAYAAGDYLILNGLLYKVTTAIASGGTITVGTNVTATTVGARMKDLNVQHGILASSNLNACTTNGIYHCSGANSYTNMPTGVTYGLLAVWRGESSGTFISQNLYTNDGLYVRFGTQSGSTWSGWILNASRNYVDNFKGGRSYIRTSLSQGGTLRLNVSPSARLKVSGFTSNTSSGFEYWIGVYGSAAQMAVIEVVKNTSITYSISDGVITFSNSGNFDDQVYVDVLVGTVTVAS